MRKITLGQARRIGNQLKVNWEEIPLDQFRNGMNVELEHANVTGGGLKVTGKIALAHFKERPDYYILLDKLEKAPPADANSDKWDVCYNWLKSLASRHGFKVEETERLHDYGAMQPRAAEAMGFPGRSDTMYVSASSVTRTKCFDLAHELLEHYRMSHLGESYWTAHVASLKAEDKGDSMFSHVERTLEGRPVVAYSVKDKKFRRQPRTPQPATTKVRR